MKAQSHWETILVNVSGREYFINLIRAPLYLHPVVVHHPQLTVSGNGYSHTTPPALSHPEYTQ